MFKIGPKIKKPLHHSHFSHFTHVHVDYSRQASLYITVHVSIAAGKTARVATWSELDFFLLHRSSDRFVSLINHEQSDRHKNFQRAKG